MKTDIKAFLRKWDGRTLSDYGSVVSPEYKSFQTAFANVFKKIAKTMGGDVVRVIKGHYDLCCFMKFGDKYIYIDYDNCVGYGGRTYVNLQDSPMNVAQKLLVRRAESERDYKGSYNNFCTLENLERMITYLLDD